MVFSSEENKTLLQQRKGKGIWYGLYEFPLIETKSDIQEAKIIEENNEFQHLMEAKNPSVSLYNDQPIIHKLSHQHIYARFWLVDVQKLPKGGISAEKVKEYPVPVLIQNFLNEIDIENL